eukprot:2836979-Alexandrium_andersonii.AAC.1
MRSRFEIALHTPPFWRSLIKTLRFTECAEQHTPPSESASFRALLGGVTSRRQGSRRGLALRASPF